MWLLRLARAKRILLTYRITMALCAGISFYCYEFFLRILTGAYQDQIVSFFDIKSHIGFSFLISSYNLTYLLMQIPAGMLLDKYGSRKCLITATLACGFGSALFVSGDYNIALLGRLLVGAGSSFAFVGVLKLARESLPRRHFGLFASVVISLGTLAAAFSQQISVLLSNYHFLWQEIFIYSGAVAIPLSLFFFAVIPKNDLNKKLLPDFSEINLAIIRLSKNKLLWLNAVWAGLIYIPTVVITSQYGVYFFSEIYNATKYQATQLITVLLLGWVLFSPLVVFFSTTTKRIDQFVMFLSIMMMVNLAFFAFFPAFMLNHLFIYIFIFGIFSSVQVLVWQYFNRICEPSMSGIGIAITNMIITLVTEVGQLTSGFALDFSTYMRYVNHHGIFKYDTQFILVLFIVFVVLGVGIFKMFRRQMT
ncbi:MFS transporter [Thiotrichales bacterium 19S9-12]|nr:MFS transporter [Thiotrichales bacterium 19S9-11]MCF6811696.1 MFS transporter [Thiotrichales bacterium 19S9-12]